MARWAVAVTSCSKRLSSSQAFSSGSVRRAHPTLEGQVAREPLLWESARVPKLGVKLRCPACCRVCVTQT